MEAEEYRKMNLYLDIRRITYTLKFFNNMSEKMKYIYSLYLMERLKCSHQLAIEHISRYYELSHKELQTANLWYRIPAKYDEYVENNEYSYLICGQQYNLNRNLLVLRRMISRNLFTALLLKYYSNTFERYEYNLPFYVREYIFYLGFKNEGFSSIGSFPYFDRTDVSFCSMIQEDKNVGSLGSFFDVDVERLHERGNWHLFPPIYDRLYLKTIDKIMKLMDYSVSKFDHRSVIMFMPKQKSEYFVDLMKANKYCTFIDSIGKNLKVICSDLAETETVIDKEMYCLIFRSTCDKGNLRDAAIIDNIRTMWN